MLKDNFKILVFIFISVNISSVYAKRVDVERDSLRNLAAAKGRSIGSAVDIQALTNDQTYQQVLATEFNSITPENALKFDATQPQKGTFDFRYADTIVNFAHANNMQIRGHTFTWHEALPAWLTEKKYSKKELEEILHNHIKTVVSRYKGKIYCWDVVNEAFNYDGSMRQNIWYEAMGEDYVEKAFRWAHEADPQALLFYNDDGHYEFNPKSEAIFQFLKYLKSKNVPIHGVGFEAHLDANFDDMKSMDANFKRFAHLGLGTDITEVDVSIIKNLDSPKAKRDTQQAGVYKAVVRVCLNNPSCKSITMWGFSDAYNWKKRENAKDTPAIFDEQYKKKPAYHSIRKLLEQP